MRKRHLELLFNLLVVRQAVAEGAEVLGESGDVASPRPREIGSYNDKTCRQ
jgi:hypothetical protein